MTVLIQIIVTLVLLFASIDNAASGWEEVEVAGHPGVIVAPADGDAFGLGADSYWTPTIADLTAAETAIREAEGDLAHNRQYIGTVVDAEAKIHVNGFCDDFGIDWRSQPVLVDDGGDCFFSAQYDMATDTLDWFTYNGFA